MFHGLPDRSTQVRLSSRTRESDGTAIRGERDAGGIRSCPMVDSPGPDSSPDAHLDAKPDSPAPPRPGPIPPVVKDASEWAWRLIGIAVAAYGLSLLLRELSEVVVPILVSLLLTAMLFPLTQRLRRRFKPGASAGLTVLLLLVVVGGLLAVVTTTVSGGMGDLTASAAQGIEQIRDWLRTTFKVSDTQFTEYVDKFVASVRESGQLGTSASRAGMTAAHFIAGFFITMFATFFFLFEGRRIWSWVVRLFPRNARERADGAGAVAFAKLGGYVRATVQVAAVDAVGITIGALILRVPFALAIGVIVFLFSFIPIVGALLSGAVAVLLALVANGPVSALVMLAVVIAVQQVESHVLQPFLMGRSVNIHPLAIILGIAAGSTLAGIVGALMAVPTIAVVNAVVSYLAAYGTTEAEAQEAEPLAVAEAEQA